MNPDALESRQAVWRGQILESNVPSADGVVKLSPDNIRAYVFDVECKAVNQWPDDPIVRRNARIIRTIENVAEKTWQARINGR